MTSIENPDGRMCTRCNERKPLDAFAKTSSFCLGCRISHTAIRVTSAKKTQQISDDVGPWYGDHQSWWNHLKASGKAGRK